MATDRSADDTVLDPDLDYIKAHADTMAVCTTHPVDGAHALQAVGTEDGVMLATHAITSADFTGPANSDIAGGGRMVTVAAQAGVEILATGTAAHLALCSDDTLLFVTVASALGDLTDGNTINKSKAVATRTI